jgi:DnaK suppressor protein
MDPDRARELLTAERARLEATIARLDAEFAPGSADALSEERAPDDGAYELNEREQDLGRLEDLRERLEAVGRAEGRLAEGTYGLSVESGEPIPDARLERFPAAERTVEEQRRFERGGL